MTWDNDYRICSVCKKMDVVFRDGNYVLFHYSTRRYAHAACMVRKHGKTEAEKLIRHGWLVKMFRESLKKGKAHAERQV